jgi:hypothetical protein
MEATMAACKPSTKPSRRNAGYRHKAWALVLAAAWIAVAATVGFSARPRKPVDPVETTAAAVAAAVAGAGHTAPIDHSVVQSQALPDEPELAGASIGAYAP